MTAFSELLVRARDGDRDAIEEIVRHYETEVRVLARVRLGGVLRPYLDSADVVQSVHRSLMVGLRAGKFDISSPDRLVALALTMVRRKIARRWRKNRRQTRQETIGDSRLLADLVVSLAHDSDPSQHAEIKDELAGVLQRMNETEQRVIQLRLEGHSTAEAARQLELDADVVRVRLSRLRRRLQRMGLFADWL